MKKILKTPFFENCVCVLCPWPRAFLSLASSVSVLGRAVLGLGFEFFFFVLCLGLEPCVLDSTSGRYLNFAFHRGKAAYCFVVRVYNRLAYKY